MNYFGTMSPSEAKQLNALVLAYVGDAVQSLYVREKLVHEHDLKAGGLHVLASDVVNAHAQMLLAESVFDSLTDDEKAVFLRARNSKSHHKAKNQSGDDYKKASALEAVLGYLYLTGNAERIKQILGEIK